MCCSLDQCWFLLQFASSSANKVLDDLSFYFIPVFRISLQSPSHVSTKIKCGVKHFPFSSSLHPKNSQLFNKQPLLNAQSVFTSLTLGCYLAFSFLPLSFWIFCSLKLTSTFLLHIVFLASAENKHFIRFLKPDIPILSTRLPVPAGRETVEVLLIYRANHLQLFCF